MKEPKVNITIKFTSMKDLGQVYKVQLVNLKQLVSTIENNDDLRDAELLLKEMLSIVEMKKYQKSVGE